MSTTQFIREAVRLLATTAFVRLSNRLLPGEGEDLRQDVLERALRYEARGGEVPRNMSAWLSTVMRNAALSVIQSRKASNHLPAFDPAMSADAPALHPIGRFEGEELVAASEANVEADAVGEIDGRRDAGMLLRAIDRLPEEQRTAIVRTYFDGISIRDEAGQGVLHGTVVSRISRAKDGLAADLGSSRPRVLPLRRSGSGRASVEHRDTFEPAIMRRVLVERRAV